jgi:RNA polymerase sigma-54 factor
MPAAAARHHGFGGTPVETLVRDHLRLLQNTSILELAKASTASRRDQGAPRRHQAPRSETGSRYSPSDSQYVIPDVYIIKTDDGYKAVLNEDGLPQLRISPVYRRLLDKSGENVGRDARLRQGQVPSALWLLKSVDQRQKTILKVATSIITFQRAFLDSGIEHLRPLVLRDVANDIGMHESTVSRVVNNKYMHTPQGVFELKYFFHSGISSSFGESVSSVTIKQRSGRSSRPRTPSVRSATRRS